MTWGRGRVTPFPEPEPDETHPHRSAGRRAIDDWKQGAPRWFLILMLMGAAGLLGTQYTERRYLESALADGPSKYQARQAERLAALETKVENLAQAVEESNRTDRERIAVLTRLTTQVEALAKVRR